MTFLARWFEPVSPSRDYRPRHILLLWLILAAGAAVRFWSLGHSGLRGDEDIMALAARGVLKHGVPVLPSGMIYARAPLHTYMIAAAVRVFGESEWALRFPSALVGSCCGLLAFFMGKRFLNPAPNLAFAAVITFLPAMIIDSQMARMYILFLACLLLYGVWLFRAERTGRVASLVVAFLAWLIALQFHLLSVFAAPLLLLPGFLRPSRRLLVTGVVLFGLAAVCFVVLNRATQSFYPPASAHIVIPEEPVRRSPDLLLRGSAKLLLGIALAAAAALIALGRVMVARRGALRAGPLLLGLSVVLCAFAQYHLGAIAFLFGVLAWARSRPGGITVPLLVAAAVAVIAAVQILILHGAAHLPARKIVSALVGTPGIWPTLRFTEFTRVGVLLYALILGLALVRLARGRTIPVHFLFFAVAAWAPLLAIGCFRWNVPSRYAIGALPFFLMCLMAGISYVLDTTRWGARLKANPMALGVAWLLLTAAVVGPRHLAVAARNDYTDNPDHKGAAEFIQSLHPGPDDLLIAEDSIVQTYYLGHVDYRLLNVNEAAEHSILVKGVLRGQYTGTPIVGSGSALLSLLDQPRNGQVYIIGSGEEFPDRTHAARGNGINDVLMSSRLEVIHEGRDRLTKVWRLRR